MADNRNPHIPLWGGLASLVGSPWSLYTFTRRGFSPVGWMFPTFNTPNDRHPLRQRLILNDIGTNGDSWLDIDSDDGNDLPALDDDGNPTVLPPDDPAQNAGNPPATTWEFEFNPFRLVLRAVPLPILGFLDVFVQRAKPVVYAIVSLVYQSLPLNNIVRLSRFTRILTKSVSYRHAPGPTKMSETCRFCKSTYQVYDRRKVSKNAHCSYTRIRCEHAYDQVYHTSALLPVHKVDNPPLDAHLVDDPNFRANCPSISGSPTDDRVDEICKFLGVVNNSPCQHPISDHNMVEPQAFIPDPTPDGLYTLPPYKVWRKENRANGVRCAICYPDSLHNWNPDIILGIRKFDSLTRYTSLSKPELVEIWKIIATITSLVKSMRQLLRAGKQYCLTAVTRSRVSKYVPIANSMSHIVLVDSDSTWLAISTLYPWLAGKGHYVFVLPTIRSETAFASWRYVFASVCPVDCGFLILNQKLSYYEPLMASVLVNLAIPWSSGNIGHTYPMYMGTAYITGNSSQLDSMTLAYLFYVCGDLYGFDEIVPALWERLTVVLLTDDALPPIMAPMVDARLKPYTIVNYVLTGASPLVRKSYVADFTRENIFYMASLGSSYVDEGRVSIAHAFADPRPISTKTVTPDIVEVQWDRISPIDPRFEANSAPGENILSEISFTHGGVTYFTFGSQGDRNPVLANARYIAALGVKVTVIHLNDEAEGRLLANFNHPDHQDSIRLFVRAREVVASYGAMPKIVPYQLFSLGSISYSLAPPDDLIHPFVSSNNVLLAFCYSALGSVFGPDFRIGAFAEAKCLPTSSDGKEFMTAVMNTSKPGVVKAWWGGDGIPAPGWEHVPLLASGDHASLMAEVDTLITKGTVGTVARAALSGCKVVAVADGFDREYRNPFDAGVGFIDGQDPDRHFLALIGISPAYLGVWLRSNWYNVRQMWAWFGPEGIGLAMFRMVMFYLYLTRLQRFTFLSTNPLTTVILMLDGRSSVPLRTYLGYLFIAKVADTTLLNMSKNYIWLAQHFVRLNTKLMSSSLAFWIAQTKGWFWGLVAAQSIGVLEPLLSLMVNWVPLTLGVNPDKELPVEDEYAVVEFVLVWSYIPVLHTALVFPFSNLRVEGGVDEFGLYTAKKRYGHFHSPFVFPTRLTKSFILSNLSSCPHLPYGPTWHCYSVIWHVVGKQLSRLGIALIPYSLALAASSVLSFAAVAGLSVMYTIASSVPAIGGLSVRRYGLVSQIARASRDALTMIERAQGDYLQFANVWFARLTFLIPLAPNPERK